jgi:GntR family transcriptional regulator of arabinose operon
MSRKVSSIPLYRKIFDRLSADILSGRYQLGQKFPSEAALVKRFGASRITVGRAVRELQQRGLVERIPGSGTYVSHGARDSKQPLLFGLIIPNLGETEIFEPICQGIAASPDSNGHALLWPHAGTAPSSSNEEQALQLCDQCIARAVSGVFFAPLELSVQSAAINSVVMKRLQDARIPIVLLDRRPEEASNGQRCDMVGIDNHRAGYIATEHLLEGGARRTGFIAYANQASTVKARIAGYRDALITHGVSVDHVYHLPSSSRLELPAAAIECDAFVCANDRVAGYLMHSLMERGVRIPRDVCIVGIDDVNYAALLPSPLTTVHQPCRDIGEAALRLMLERLAHPKMPARDVLIDCAIVIRESSRRAG